MNSIRTFFSIAFLLFFATLHAQVVDDTTRLIFGPTTSKYTFERNIKFNQEQFYYIDTAVYNFHRFNYVEKADNFTIDLGEIGTAMRSIYYEPPKVIGARPGFDGFEPYFKTPDQFRFFNTKSPHIDMNVILAGGGRSITEVMITRNIGALFNAGFSYNQISTDKQISRAQRGDRRVLSIAYDAFFGFRTRNGKYKGMFSASRTRHKVFESGGIKYGNNTEIGDLYEDTVSARLDNGNSVELRKNLHYYHQFQLKPGIEIYHSFDKYGQLNEFFFIPLSDAPSGYFDDFFISTDTTAEAWDYDYLQNEVGLKGSIGNLFYNGYYKRKDNEFSYKYADSLGVPPTINIKENYFGFNVRYQFDSLKSLKVNAELLDNGRSSLGAELNFNRLYVNVKQSNYNASLLEQAYFGNHDQWTNDFDTQHSFLAEARFKYKIGPIDIIPGYKFTNLNDYVFFGLDTLPTQSAGSININSPSLGYHYRFLRYFHLEGQIIYTNTSGSSKDDIRIPEFFLNAKLFFRKKVFNHALDMEAGIDTHWHSSYYGDNYYPVLQRYYVQDVLELPGAFKADLFFSGRIGHGRIFLKLINLKQMFTGEGYLVAPYYRGQNSTIDFGFSWQFYD